MIHTQDFESAQLLPLTATHSVVSGLACAERALVSAFKTWTRSLRIADLVGACVLEFLPDRQENCLVLEGHGETDRPTACGLLVQPPHTTCKEAIKGPLLPLSAVPEPG